jgi:hypothetical protein
MTERDAERADMRAAGEWTAISDRAWTAINARLTALHARKLAIANGPDTSSGMSLALACEADGIEDALATLAAHFGRTVTWPGEL